MYVFIFKYGPKYNDYNPSVVKGLRYSLDVMQLDSSFIQGCVLLSAEM